MRATAILLLSTVLLSVLTVACGYGSNFKAINGTTPKITQLIPQNVIANSGPFTLMIVGYRFTSGSIVYWNATPLVATVDSSTQLTVNISAAVVANAGMVAIYVHGTGGNSNTMMFNVD